jgi:dethiobiotin synthetase
MTSSKFFITGTDTEIGKTYVSVALLKMFNKLGKSTIGAKPVSTGGFMQDNTIMNHDALALWQNSSIQLPYHKINPFSFLPPISPNIASNGQLTAQDILTTLSTVLTHKADITIIEGIGGWYTPINNTETMATFVKQANLPVIMVVGIRLGCLNHAILTYCAIKESSLMIKGWIANCVDPGMISGDDNIATLEEHISAPLLGVIGYQGDYIELTSKNPLSR